MSQLLAGLVGVLVGGFITAGVEAWTARRATMHARRQATRILRGDLMLALGAAKAVPELGSWKPLQHACEQLLATWRETRVPLASMRDDTWNVVEGAMTHLAIIQSTSEPSEANRAAAASRAEAKLQLALYAVTPAPGYKHAS